MKLPAERCSLLLLRVLILGISLMFLGFYTIGYNRLFDDDTRFREPQLTSALIIFVAVFLGTCLLVSLWSVYVTWRRRAHDSQTDKLHKRMVGTGLVVVIVGGALIGWTMGSSAPMVVNGQVYDNVFWLRTANMFVALCMAMALLTLMVLVISSLRSMRKHGL